MGRMVLTAEACVVKLLLEVAQRLDLTFFHCNAVQIGGVFMSDWERRLQELGLLGVVVLLVLTMWIFVELRKSQSKGVECIILNADGEQVTRRGKQCASDDLF